MTSVHLGPTYPRFTVFQIVACDLYKDYIHIYTDGFKNSETGNTGLAIIVENSLGNEPTISRAQITNNLFVFTSERLAIKYALQIILSTKPPNKKSSHFF